MAYIATTDGRYPSGPSRGSSGKVAQIVALVGIASGSALWIMDFNPRAFVARMMTSIDQSSFDERFQSVSTTPPTHMSPRLLVQAWSSELELKLNQAKGRLAQKLQAQDAAQALQASIEQTSVEQQQSQPAVTAPAEQTAAIDEPAPPTTPAVPLPRARPVEANLELPGAAPATTGTVAVASAQAEDRTWLQKLSDLLPSGGIKMASLGPNDGGIASGGPDLTKFGYDKTTAVYDLTAHVVYMPNGVKLEAHSGMGRLMDDPAHVSEKMVGATPPAVYDLKMREKIFHGVEALRMTPEDSNATLGRTGLLTHPYMLGPNGDSNGCVSIKNYDYFLTAYKNGEVNRLVVVPSFNTTVPDTRRADSQT
jgi:type VI secretion system (T6SS) effector TldE1-like protein